MTNEQLELGIGDKPSRMEVGPGAWHLPRTLQGRESAVLDAMAGILEQSPWRQMKTPGGRTIRVSMSSCGDWGWISDAQGYRYSPVDPQSQAPWPKIPPLWRELVSQVAETAGYPDFCPDACLLNRYTPGLSMGMHQDADEQDFEHPIVSFSLGLDAAFRFGGPTRQSPAQTIRLAHGDAVVWGGPSRRYYHGISRVYPGEHPRLGAVRINLTFRRAG